MLRRIGTALALAGIIATFAGCSEKRADQAPETVALDTSYNRCREVAVGDGTALISCSDTVIKQAAALQPDRGKTAAFLKQLAQKAEARLGEDTLAARVGVADVLAKAALETSAGQTATSVASRFDARMMALREKSEKRSSSAPALGGYVPPNCSAVRSARSADTALAQFESEFPRALQDEALVETLTLNDAQLRAISLYLACLAERTDFGPDVVENSLWFYASKRHGKRAHAILDELGRTPGPDGGAAKAFSAQVSEYLATSVGGNG